MPQHETSLFYEGLRVVETAFELTAAAYKPERRITDFRIVFHRFVAFLKVNAGDKRNLGGAVYCSQIQPGLIPAAVPVFIQFRDDQIGSSSAERECFQVDFHKSIVLLFIDLVLPYVADFV